MADDIKNNELLVRIDERQKSILTKVDKIEKKLDAKVDNDEEYQGFVKKVDTLWDRMNKALGYAAAAGGGAAIFLKVMERALKI